MIYIILLIALYVWVGQTYVVNSISDYKVAADFRQAGRFGQFVLAGVTLFVVALWPLLPILALSRSVVALLDRS